MEKTRAFTLLQSCDAQGKAWCGTWKDRSLWAFFREKFCHYLGLIIVWHFRAIFCRRSALTEPKASGEENKLPHRQKNCCNSPGEFALSKKPMEQIPLPRPWAGNKENRIGHFSECDCTWELSVLEAARIIKDRQQSQQWTVLFPPPVPADAMEGPISCHLPGPDSPHPQACPAASWDLAEINGLGSLQDLAPQGDKPASGLTPLTVPAGTDHRLRPREWFCAQLQRHQFLTVTQPSPPLRHFKRQ